MAINLTLANDTWDKIVKHVNRAPGAPPFVIEKRGGSVRLSKEWDPQEKEYVWIKTHQAKSSIGLVEDVSFLCGWEYMLINQAAFDRAKGCVLMCRSFLEASPVFRVGTPENERQHLKSVLRTFDAGPTLNIWETMKPRIEGSAMPHPFAEQGNYLQLVRGILIALENFHKLGFVHCDLHSANIALPVRDTNLQTTDKGVEYICVEPLWDKIRVIDLDFSASRNIVPPFRLGHDVNDSDMRERLSDHLRFRLEAIDRQLSSQGQLDRCYEREFWHTARNKDQLKCFQSLDWREDLHQLGVLLTIIRERWGGAKHVSSTSPFFLRDVNIFIEEFPAELKEWGIIKKTDWDSINLTSTVPPPDKFPHADYVSRIDNLLHTLRQCGSLTESMVLLRSDHDPQYKAELDKQRLAEEESTRQEILSKKEAEQLTAAEKKAIPESEEAGEFLLEGWSKEEVEFLLERCAKEEGELMLERWAKEEKTGLSHLIEFPNIIDKNTGLPFRHFLLKALAIFLDLPTTSLFEQLAEQGYYGDCDIILTGKAKTCMVDLLGKWADMLQRKMSKP